MRRGGFTLIELLVAVSVLSLVLLVASTSLGWYAQGWSQRLGHFDSEATVTETEVRLQQMLLAIDFYEVRRGARSFPYFDGGPQHLRAVSLAPLRAGAVVAVIDLRLNDDGELEYREQRLDQAPLLQPGQLEYLEPQILAREVTDFRLEYFGWFDVAARLLAAERGRGLADRAWHSAYFGERTRQLPQRLRLRYTLTDGRQQHWELGLAAGWAMPEVRATSDG